MLFRSPTFRSMQVNDNKAELKFDNAEGGLAPRRDINGFEAAGSDRKFYPATAIVGKDNNTIIVTCDNIDKIESVRYCFKNFAIGEVYSTIGLPLMPFRTDSWD